MAQAPFTAYIKVVPDRGRLSKAPTSGAVVVRKGGRTDHLRSLQHLAVAIHESIEAYAEDNPGVVIARPGGGQPELQGLFGSLKLGCAVKPQFGEQPAMVMVEGFCSVAAEPSVQPNVDTTIIHCGDVMTGPSGLAKYSSTPSTNTSNEARSLIEYINYAIADVSDDSGNPLKVYRLEYKGIIWGNRGLTFPR